MRSLVMKSRVVAMSQLSEGHPCADVASRNQIPPSKAFVGVSGLDSCMVPSGLSKVLGE